jgi:phosphate transport system substrate-binding protein
MIQGEKNFKILGFFIFLSFFRQDGQASSLLRIVGSSTVFPFAATVAEHFSYKTHESVPLIETIGTGAGIKLFCESLNGPDGVIASRAITANEAEKCREQGVTYEELKIGKDGLVIIQSKEETPFSLTLKTLKEAIAEKIQQGAACLTNPYKTWNEIQQNYPLYSIRILGPAPTSGTYDVLIDNIIGDCGPYLRSDGAYIEAPANENLIIQKVLNAPQTLGVVTFSFYDQNRTRIQALALDAIFPSFKSIQEGSYPLSRPLYLYIKTNDLKDFPMRAAYALEFTSEEAIGEQGYLKDKGLVPLSLQEQHIMNQRVRDLQQKEER